MGVNEWRSRRAEIFFLPFALPDGAGQELPLDAEVLSRRIPDLLHQILNGGPDADGPAGMLEIHLPDEEAGAQWISLTEVPDVDEVLERIRDEAEPRALVTGELRSRVGTLEVQLTLNFAEPAQLPMVIHGVLDVLDPMHGLLSLAKHLSSTLRLPFHRPETGALGTNATAFFEMLQGLDGAAKLQGDFFVEGEQGCVALVEPLVRAVEVDSSCGWALNAFAQAVFLALETGRATIDPFLDLIDRSLVAEPAHSEACVAVAETLASLGRERRAESWLRHATELSATSPAALECLGVLLANRGESVEARELWQRGIEGGGGPDFFAHLGRLAFAEGRIEDGWEKFRRGIWRLWERSERRDEWDPTQFGPTVLLRYLAEHIQEQSVPEDLPEALEELVGLLEHGVERMDLGRCLVLCDRPYDAVPELESALVSGLDHEMEDEVVELLLRVEVPDFEHRYKQAMRGIELGTDPISAIAVMREFLERRPQFWPALRHTAAALRHLGHVEEALDVYFEVLLRRPDDRPSLLASAEIFSDRGNPKRALELVESVLQDHPGDEEGLFLRAACLERLGRLEDADSALERAVQSDSSRD